MYNPFENLDARLAMLEIKLDKLLDQQPAALALAAAEAGGIELAQEITRLSKARIYALVSAREIPHTKRGNRLTFNRGELLTWRDGYKRGTTANETAADA